MGIALLVHPDCPYPVHHIPTTSPYLLSCQIADILIHCVYLPPSASYSDIDAINFIESLPLSTHTSQTNTIICGDFNARNRRLLGDSRSNTRGTALHDFIMHHNITCWNATLAFGQPTYHTYTNEREDTSIIDLFLSTNPLDSPSIAIENDMDLGSDHKPVSLSFTPSSPPPPQQPHPRQLWHLSKLSDPEIRSQYSTHLTTNLQPIIESLTLAIDDNHHPPDIDALANTFTDAIHKALDTSIGRKKPGTRDNRNKWFWNDDLQAAFDRREYCYQRLRHADELERPFWIEQHTDAKTHMKSLIASRKRETWKQFCEKLAKDDFGKTTATIKRIRQHRMTSPTFTHPNGSTAAANTMANHLKQVYAGSFLPSTRPSPPPLEPVPHQLDDDHPFSTLDVKEAIEHAARRKAPGVDHLRAEMLAPVSDIIAPPLALLFQLCWKWSITPLSWRLAQVVPIYKKGEPTHAANYRPISLLSVIRKIMEQCLRAPLHESSPQLDLAQGGFRPQRSAMDQALCLHELAQRHRIINHNRNPILVFLDIKSAYDTVDRNIIWRELETRASYPLLGLLRSLFDDVSIQVLLSGATSDPFHPATGVLQGSILSPHLYSLYINSLPNALRNIESLPPYDDDFVPVRPLYRSVSGLWMNCLLYADDVVLIADAATMPHLLSIAEAHSYQLGYRWNPAKCIVINASGMGNSPPLQLYHHPIPTADSFAYLGIPFNNGTRIDPSLLIQRNTSSTIAAMRTLETLGCNPRGFPRLLAIRLYQQFIRPKMEYGLAITPFNKAHLRKLEQAQDSCLRRIFGGHSKSSTKAFRHMANLPTMQDRVAILGAKFLIRAFSLPDDALLPIMKPLISNSHVHLWHKLTTTNTIWNQLPPPPQEADRRTLKTTIKKMRLDRFMEMRDNPHSGVMLSFLRPTLTLDPILFLPMTARERSRLLRWRMGWLPGKPIACICGDDHTSRRHLYTCLDVATRLQVPHDAQPNPIDHLLNKLPSTRPRKPYLISFWEKHWPPLMDILSEIDQRCHPHEDKPDDANLGMQFLQWLRTDHSPPPTSSDDT